MSNYQKKVLWKRTALAKLLKKKDMTLMSFILQC